MKIKNDIKWLKERKFVTEIGTPDKINTRNELRSYITQVSAASQLKDEVSDEGGSSDNYRSQYLTFEALEGGTFSFSKNGLNYSLDNGTSWNTLGANTNITVSNGDKVMFKGEYTNTTTSIGQFKMASKFNISGNIMSLLFGDNFVDKTDLTGYGSAFERLFEGTSVVDASKLVLPATILSKGCYGRMFRECTSLTTAPELPATTLAEECYYWMFRECTSLTAAPELPATTLTHNCYYNMFYSCTSLTTAPELPATTLAENCYDHMFTSCTSLTAAPELPATTLAQECYSGMFQRCFSLTTAPDLPATILADRCYNLMFHGCTKLNYIKAMFTTTPSTSYTNNWVFDVPSTGTFVKNAAAAWDVTGTYGIPGGWTVETATV